MISIGTVVCAAGLYATFGIVNNAPQTAITLPEPPEASFVETMLPTAPEEPSPVEEEELPQEEEIQSLRLNYLAEQSIFELPLQGASAYASVDMNLRATANGATLLEIPNGGGFTILAEEGDWWKVRYQETEGYVYANYCLLNLPDVLPSAVYENTNASASVFQSSFYPLEGITGEKLYDAYEYNPRLGHDEYTMVILYQTAKKVAQVQQKALANGETLIINETYRPLETQNLIVDGMTQLSRSNATVLEGITKPPWSMNWFIAIGMSSHQYGYAIDASLGKVLDTEERISGDYVYQAVTDYQEWTMPTPLHELSYHSASMDREYIEIEVPAPTEEEIPEEDLLPEEEQLSPELSPEDAWTESPEDSHFDAEHPAETPVEPSPDSSEDTSTETTPEIAPEIAPEITPEATPEAPPEAPEITPEAPVEPPVEAPVETPPEGTSPVPEGDLEVWDTPAEGEAVNLSMSFSQNSPISATYRLQTLSEVLEETPSEDSGDSATVTTTISQWVTAETMTEASIRLQSYFKSVGMEPIGSEWWHFNDYSHKGPAETYRNYYIVGLYSLPPMA